jgi:hypothetical protein
MKLGLMLPVKPDIKWQLALQSGIQYVDYQFFPRQSVKTLIH